MLKYKIYKKGMEEGFDRTGKNCSYCQDTCNSFCRNYKPFITTSNGKMYLDEGDYIVVDRKGYNYPIRSDIFELLNKDKE